MALAKESVKEPFEAACRSVLAFISQSEVPVTQAEVAVHLAQHGFAATDGAIIEDETRRLLDALDESGEILRIPESYRPSLNPPKPHRPWTRRQ
jgi:hypothetical protein